MKITQHVKSAHAMTKEDYVAQHGPVIAAVSSKNYAKSENWNWIEREKAKGNDLVEYRKKMSDSVREAVMSDPEERKRRGELRTELNKRPEHRELCSRVAKITSARPEILEARTQRLATWRVEHPDEFFAKCVVPFLFSDTIKKSRPERALHAFLIQVPGYNFRYAQMLKDDLFITKTKRKQVDFGDHARRVYVEFDGRHHFDHVFSRTQENLECTQQRDRALNEFIKREGFTLVRISQDQFSYKRGGFLLESCLHRLTEILNAPQPGVVYFIGNAYKEDLDA
jgi:very-short-patch-repair endonuclease